MRDMTYTPRALCRAAGLSETETEHALTGVGSMRLLRWVSRNMVRTVEDCPTCGAVTDGGELHGDTCEHGRCGARALLEASDDPLAWLTRAADRYGKDLTRLRGRIDTRIYTERRVRVRRCVHDVKADICAEPCGTCGHRCCDHDPDGGCGMWPEAAMDTASCECGVFSERPEDDPQMTDDDRADAEADGRLERRREDEQERRQGAREA